MTDYKDIESDVPLQSSVSVEVLRVRGDEKKNQSQLVASEVPFTIIANGQEISTFLCSPINLEEMTYGFLFSSGFINQAGEVNKIVCDNINWKVEVTLAREPEPEMLRKRLYTSGCGKGVMYAHVHEISNRRPLVDDLRITAAKVSLLAQWLQKRSQLYRDTGGVHTAGLSQGGKVPDISMDDIGRHNAVDKVLGRALLTGFGFTHAILVCSGRTSSEILHKARRSNIALTLSRGAPTHQTVMLAREMNITVIGFARGDNFTVYSHQERVG